jgi:glycine/D-amino acid oxidase-like deaminating enzyme
VGRQAGLTVDPAQGVYFRPEGAEGHFICGVSPPEDEDPDCPVLDTQDVDMALFEETIWPTIAARVPAFESLRVTAQWAGLYEYNTWDQNALMGAFPGVDNLLVCNGFSGHGLQQSPAAGRAMSELILDGEYTSLNCSIFGLDRLVRDDKVLERNIV